MTQRSLIERGWLWFISLFFYLTLIFILSHMTTSDLNFIHLVIWDKLVHFCEYLPVGFLLCGWFHVIWKQKKFAGIALLSLLAVIGLAGFDELHQSFVPTRDASGFDMIADILGGGLGIASAYVFFRTFRRGAVGA